MHNLNATQNRLLPKQPNRSLIEGMRVLQFVMNHPEPSRVIDIAQVLGIEQTRAHRLLRTLTALGYLQQIKGRRYIGGSAVPILASQALLASGFVHHTFPILQQLRKQTHLLVAYGLFWERTVSYLFHSRPGTKIEMAISGHDVLPATRSRIGLAILSQMSDVEVSAIYTGHDTDPFESIESLLEKLHQYREAGYAYDRGFANKRDPNDNESSIAIAIPGNPNAALAVGGIIPPEEVSLRVKEMKDAIKKIIKI